MACSRVKWGWRPIDGRGLTFTRPHPAERHRFEPEPVAAACGKCELCQAKARLDWSVRMYHEAQTSDRSSFVTLTFRNAPEELERAPLQRFIKRLRYHSKKPIRYFACGERGEKTNRVHYHACIFGEDFLGGAYDIDDQLYGNRVLDGIWGNGIVAVGEFTLASACYVAGYVSKKLGDPDTFNTMSKKPPIGLPWVRRYHNQLVRSGNVTIEGQQFPMPAVYARWLSLPEVFENRRESASEPLTDSQAVARELAAKAKRQLKAKELI